VLFLAYDVALGHAITGRGLVGLGVWAWLLVWLPNTVAQLFGPKDTYLFQPSGNDAEPPQYSSAVTGISLALLAGGLLLVWTHEVAARQLELPDSWESSGFVNIIALILGAVTLHNVPRAAMLTQRYYLAQSRRLVEAESARALARSQVLQAQMRPHFLFNALNTVTALMREDPQRGRDVLLRLRALLERSLPTTAKPMIALKEEVAFVRDQLAIEQERFRDRLTVTFDVDDELLTQFVPPFCLQPLVENALRHGIARSLDGGHVRVGVSRGADGRLRLEVTDSGAGLDPHWKEGTGLSNLRQRLAATYGAASSLSVTSGSDTTTAVVTIPAASQIRDRPVPPLR
jgi:sensor histidine kinase YesM